MHTKLIQTGETSFKLCGIGACPEIDIGAVQAGRVRIFDRDQAAPGEVTLSVEEILAFADLVREH